jgi:hypothetical protein
MKKISEIFQDFFKLFPTGWERASDALASTAIQSGVTA